MTLYYSYSKTEIIFLTLTNLKVASLVLVYLGPIEIAILGTITWSKNLGIAKHPLPPPTIGLKTG